MCEGGISLLNHIKNNLDMLMLFVSLKDSNNINLDNFKDFKIVYSYNINDTDKVIFFQ
jgi:hypothetical protein